LHHQQRDGVEMSLGKKRPSPAPPRCTPRRRATRRSSVRWPVASARPRRLARLRARTRTVRAPGAVCGRPGRAAALPGAASAARCAHWGFRPSGTAPAAPAAVVRPPSGHARGATPTCVDVAARRRGPAAPRRHSLPAGPSGLGTQSAHQVPHRAFAQLQLVSNLHGGLSVLVTVQDRLSNRRGDRAWHVSPP
jgi:hypothetical protein